MIKALSFACIPAVIFQTQHPAEVGTLEQMGLGPFSLKFIGGSCVASHLSTV